MNFLNKEISFYFQGKNHLVKQYLFSRLMKTVFKQKTKYEINKKNINKFHVQMKYCPQLIPIHDEKEKQFEPENGVDMNA